MLQSSHPVRAGSPCIKNQDKQLPLKLTLQIKPFPTCGAATSPPWHNTAMWLLPENSDRPHGSLIFLHPLPHRIKSQRSSKEWLTPQKKRSFFEHPLQPSPSVCTHTVQVDQAMNCGLLNAGPTSPLLGC